MICLVLACQRQPPAAVSVSPEPPGAGSTLSSGAPVSGGVAPPSIPLAAPGTPGKALELGGKVVHPGCISELAQAIDGDSIVRSVFLLIPGARA